MKLRFVASTMLAALLIAPVVADDEANPKRKGKRAARNNAATQLLKQLQPVALTDEQVAKVKELGKVAGAKMKEIRDEAGITMELLKKRREAGQSLRGSDSKGKELQAAIDKAAGLTAAQAAAIAKQNEVRTQLHKDVVALLDDGQKEKLPKALQRVAKAAGKEKARAKGKRKKEDA